MITICGTFSFCTKEAARFWRGGLKPVSMDHKNGDFYLVLKHD